MPRTARPIHERFNEKWVLAPDGCWQWTGGFLRNGYGSFGNGRTTTAHRVAYELFVGPIPEGLTIDHLCRNRSCVNPDHLEPVTLKENIRRAKALITHCPQGHPYDEANTFIVKHSGWTSRVCRECCRARSYRNFLRRREQSQAAA